MVGTRHKRGRSLALECRACRSNPGGIARGPGTSDDAMAKSVDAGTVRAWLRPCVAPWTCSRHAPLHIEPRAGGLHAGACVHTIVVVGRCKYLVQI